MLRIATVTLNPAVDSSSSVEHVIPERKLRCAPPCHDAGGGGLNVARVVAELGGEALALWTRGGANGQLLESLLEDLSIRHQPIPIASMTRENLTVSETATGLQYRFGMPGPELSPQEVESCHQAVTGLAPAPHVLVLSGSLPRGAPVDFYARLAQTLRDQEVKVILDTSGDALRRALEAGVWLIKPNHRELGELAGEELRDDTAVEQAACRLVREGKAQVVATSLGAGGSLLVTAEQVQHVRAPTVKIRSKVGAGDSMVGGIAVGLCREWPIVEAVRLGVAAGAAAVMTPGTELCRREDVERLYDQMQNGGAEVGTVAWD